MSRRPSVLDNEFTDDKEKQATVETVREFNDSDSETDISFAKLKAADESHDISLRTMSWQKAAFLLCGEQVCLAIMAQSWSLS